MNLSWTRFAVLVLVGLLAAGLAACGGGSAQQTEAPSGDAARGATLFVGTCSSCHGPDAKGLPGLGKDLTTSEFVKGKTDVELVEFFKTGRPSSDPLNTTGIDMPPRGGNPVLSDDDLVDIVAFVRTVNK